MAKTALHDFFKKVIDEEINSDGLQLTGRELYVINELWFTPKRLEDLAKEMGVTRERIRQIETKAQKKILCHIETRKAEIEEKHAMEARREECGDTKILNQKIDTLDLSVRTYNCLRRNNIATIGGIMSMSITELMKIRNLGGKSSHEVVEKLKKYGLVLKED